MCQCSCGETAVRSSLARRLNQKRHSQLLQDQEVIREEEVIYLNTIEEIKEEAIQGEPIEEPLLEISDEETSLLHRLLTLFRRRFFLI